MARAAWRWCRPTRCASARTSRCTCSGRLLGVTAHTVYDVAELPELLDALSGQQLVLIDTAGASPRDPDLARRLRLMNQQKSKIETSLVIPASIQAGAIEEAMKLFAVAQPELLRHHQGG